jgi:hypothetical protein
MTATPSASLRSIFRIFFWPRPTCLLLEDLLDQLAVEDLALDQDLAQAGGVRCCWMCGPLDRQGLVDGRGGRQVAAHQQLADLVVRILELLGHSAPRYL